MTFDEIYEDRETVFSKVNGLFEKNKESNDEFKKFIKMTDPNVYNEVHEKMNFLWRFIFVHLMFTFIIPFSVMMVISYFIRMNLFIRFIPTIVLNIVIFIFIKQMFDQTKDGINIIYTKEYKHKKDENDLKGMIAMEKKGINDHIELTKNETYSLRWLNIIIKLYFGYDMLTINKIASDMHYIHLFHSILFKLEELKDSVKEMVGEKIKTIPKESDFIDFLNKKFDNSFIKSIFDNVDYNSKIDNLIILYYFADQIFWPVKLENGEWLFKVWYTDYEQTKDDPEKLKDITVQFISYKILKYGLEKEERENLLK